ncbi:glycerol kinase GlpK [Caenispirillum salinarum]|uniref:glycerol kinase GlpK n=1 Tax=Caenispirillum salinarum TaxID=859058 RepID=UPI00384DE7B4
MSESYVLSIDQGTTGTTVLIFDRDGAVRQRAYSEFAQHYPRPGWVEHDASEIWKVTVSVIADALKQGGIKASDIAAIGITNQRETVVLWDRKTGRPVHNAIVWQDRRTAKYCDELAAKEGLPERLREKTGLVIDPYFSGTKVKWMLDNVSGLRARAEKGEIAFGTIDSWLVWNLTGGSVHITDVSNASRTQLFNIHTLQWDDEILDLMDIPKAMLPEVRPSSQVYGQTDPDMFFGTHGIPVAGIAGDQQAALFGQACHKPGMAKNTYGTGSFLLMNTGTEAPISKEKLLTTIAWQIGEEPVEYALEGAIFITGAAVQWLRDGLGIIASASETEKLARSIDWNDGVYFVPALTGLGAPHWDAYARGTLLGLTRGTTRAHIVRATLESICYQTRDVAEAMVRDSGIELKELRCDGGASVNSFLMQFQADQLGVTVEVPRVVETTALGAAYLAGLATGYWQGRDEIAEKWQLANRYEPKMEPTEKERLYRRWLRALEHSKGWAVHKT